MAFGGRRKGVPASLYGGAIAVMEAFGWSWAEYLAAPDELVCEMEARLAGRAAAERERERRARVTR